MRSNMSKALALAAVLGAGSLLLPGTAQAQRYTAIDGTKLMALCTSRDRTQLEQCTTYIDGLSDGATFYQELLPSDGSKGGRLPAYICVPSGVTGVQMREAVVTWARAHREDLRRQASGVVLRALRDTYACR